MRVKTTLFYSASFMLTTFDSFLRDQVCCRSANSCSHQDGRGSNKWDSQFSLVLKTLYRVKRSRTCCTGCAHACGMLIQKCSAELLRPRRAVEAGPSHNHQQTQNRPAVPGDSRDLCVKGSSQRGRLIAPAAHCFHNTWSVSRKSSRKSAANFVGTFSLDAGGTFVPIPGPGLCGWLFVELRTAQPSRRQCLSGSLSWVFPLWTALPVSPAAGV